jgi:hypothetical protein
MSYIKDAYGVIIHVKEPTRSVFVVNKIFKIPTAKSSGLNTDYIVILISVLCPDDSIHIEGVVLLL